MKKNGTKDAGKQEKAVKEATPKNAKTNVAKTPAATAKVPAKTWTRKFDDAPVAPEVANDAPQGLETTREPEAASGADTGARGANGGKSKPSGARSGSLIDAAAGILQGAAEPMRCQDLVAQAAARGLWMPRTGKTPASTLYAAILREIAIKGDAGRFVKTDRGRFALKDRESVREEGATSRKA